MNRNLTKRTKKRGLYRCSGCAWLLVICLLFPALYCQRSGAGTGKDKNVTGTEPPVPAKTEEAEGENTLPKQKSKIMSQLEINRKIRNEIEFEASGGLQLEQAFLTDSKDQLVGEDNLLHSGEKFKLRLYIKNWQSEAGVLHIGASETLTTSEGDEVVKVSDLFAENSRISLADARLISLSMQVTKSIRLFDYYEVQFKVWNKTYAQMITGRYRFNLK